MPKWAKILIGVGAAGAGLAAMLFVAASMQGTRCEVCVDWNGRHQCASTTGEKEQDAYMHALRTACAPVSGGPEDQTKCEHSTPAVRNCTGP